MPLSAKKRYDYRDIDPWELKLIRVGHAIWRLYRRENARNASYLLERKALLEACETVWRLKREYREKLKKRRAEASSKIAKRFAKWQESLGDA